MSAIESAAAQMAELVKESLVFCRGVGGERVLVQPGRLIEDIMSVAREMLPPKIRVLCEVQRDVWNVSGDFAQLRQVLLKLCVQARDAMPAGGVLSIKAKNLQRDARPPVSTGPPPAPAC